MIYSQQVLEGAAVNHYLKLLHTMSGERLGERQSLVVYLCEWVHLKATSSTPLEA